MASAVSSPASVGLATVIRRVSWRILPLVVICYAIAVMDRVNIGFANLTMSADLGISAAAYGFGAGVFFVAYCLLEVPSNALLYRIGARKWIARIMLTWGIIAILTGFIQNEWQFYLARVLLGAAEAGFYPGIVYYLSKWFPQFRLSRAIAVLMVASPIANIVVGPVSGWILQVTHLIAGLQGWRWLFIIEGIPALIAGVLFLALMPDSPLKARWLSHRERELLSAEIDRDAPAEEEHAGVFAHIREGLKSRRAWAVGLLLGANYLAGWAITFWTPTLIKGTGIQSTLAIGWLSTIQWLVALVAIIVVGILADRIGHHRVIYMVGMLVSVVGLLIAVYGSAVTGTIIVGLAIAQAGGASVTAVLWVVARERLHGRSGAAAAFALINAIASVGSFLGPYALGLGQSLTGSTQIATVLISIVAAIGGIGVLFLGREGSASATAAGLAETPVESALSTPQ